MGIDIDSIVENEKRDSTIIFDNVGEEGEEELSNDLSKFSQAVIWGTDWTTETISKQLEKGNIDLNPTFQRRDAWSDAEKSRLIESLMLGLPVPPIILAENKNRKNSYIVIDGKQRLLSIRRFYSKVTDKDFRDKGLNEKDEFKQLKLRGLEILSDFNGWTYKDIEENSNEYITNLDNQAVRTIVIKNWPDESFLYTVFLRLNTGSKKLSPQELRQALHPGEFLTYLDEVTSESAIIRKMLNNKGPDPRMKDIELALRFIAFKLFLDRYTGNLKEFLDLTCEILNRDWLIKENEVNELFEQLEMSISFAQSLFADKSPFSRYSNDICNDRFNRSIFEILTYYFSIEDIRDAVSKNKVEFKEKFIEMNDDQEFIYAVSDTTKESSRVVLRFNKLSDILLDFSSIKNQGINIPQFRLEEGKIVVDSITS